MTDYIVLTFILLGAVCFFAGGMVGYFLNPFRNVDASRIRVLEETNKALREENGRILSKQEKQKRKREKELFAEFEEEEEEDTVQMLDTIIKEMSDEDLRGYLKIVGMEKMDLDLVRQFGAEIMIKKFPKIVDKIFGKFMVQ